MSDSVLDLIADEVRDCENMFEWMGVSAAVYKRVGRSSFDLKFPPSKDYLSAEDVLRLEKDFLLLCESIKNRPSMQVIDDLSCSYGAALTAEELYMLATSESKKAAALRMFRSGCYYKGFAIEGMSDKGQALRKQMLSRAGSIGGATKNKPTNELKAWALEKAKGMAGADIDIARRLARSIPESMLDASKNPERLIYEAIRSSRVDTSA